MLHFIVDTYIFTEVLLYFCTFDYLDVLKNYQVQLELCNIHPARLVQHMLNSQQSWEGSQMSHMQVTFIIISSRKKIISAQEVVDWDSLKNKF